MGPRHAGRGIASALTPPRSRSGASMGPRHAGCGIVRLGSPGPGCHPGFIWSAPRRAGYRWPVANGAALTEEASMGPRHAGRGIVAFRFLRAFLVFASMGPRHAGRGIDGFGKPSTENMFKLQWVRATQGAVSN